MTMCHAPLDGASPFSLIDVLSMMLADRRVLFCDFGHTFRLDGLAVYGRS